MDLLSALGNKDVRSKEFVQTYDSHYECLHINNCQQTTAMKLIETVDKELMPSEQALASDM